MSNADIVRVDGIKWWIATTTTGGRTAVPLCPQHNIRLDPQPGTYFSRSAGYLKKANSTAKTLLCEEGQHKFEINREYEKEQAFVLNKVDAKAFEKMSVLNLDDEAVPVASQELKDTNYWVKAKVTTSKAGTRLLVWAGDKTAKNKTQLFIEPSLKRLSFDQNDDHPMEVFAKIEATFAENVTTSIAKSVEKSTPDKEGK